MNRQINARNSVKYHTKKLHKKCFKFSLSLCLTLYFYQLHYGDNCVQHEPTKYRTTCNLFCCNVSSLSSPREVFKLNVIRHGRHRFMYKTHAREVCLQFCTSRYLTHNVQIILQNSSTTNVVLI